MNEEEEAEMIAYAATLPMAEKVEAYELAAITERHLFLMRHGVSRSMSDHEVKLSEWILAEVKDAHWYHGGVAGLSVICPACETGADPRTNGQFVPDRADRVHITTDETVARGFASALPNGGFCYRVIPVGPVSILPAHLRMASLLLMESQTFNPLSLPLTFCCGRAEVIG